MACTPRQQCIDANGDQVFDGRESIDHALRVREGFKGELLAQAVPKFCDCYSMTTISAWIVAGYDSVNFIQWELIQLTSN